MKKLNPRRNFIKTVALASMALPILQNQSQAQTSPTVPINHRERWLQALIQICTPVLNAAGAGKLKQLIPKENTPPGRISFSPLEALARLLSGIAPWLEQNSSSTTKESNQKISFRQLSRAAIQHSTNPSSPAYLNFSQGTQPLVDTAFLCQAFLYAPNTLWKPLPLWVKQNVINAVKKTRSIVPNQSNWLLFSAMVETWLHKVGESWEKSRVQHAIDSMESWYVGDGAYGDGPQFHWDYYNSFVIHPMLLQIAQNTPGQWGNRDLFQYLLPRSQRYAQVLERSISPEGRIPVIGRSLIYRFGAMQTLSQLAYYKLLPADLSPAQVRCALTSLLNRFLESPATFDSNGWLRPGFYGYQPSLAETYISRGSLYAFTWGFLPLGLPPGDSFWTDAAADWTSVKIWSGVNMPADKAIKL